MYVSRKNGWFERYFVGPFWVQALLKKCICSGGKEQRKIKEDYIRVCSYVAIRGFGSWNTSFEVVIAGASPAHFFGIDSRFWQLLQKTALKKCTLAQNP